MILIQKEGIRSLKGEKGSDDCCLLVVFLAGQKKHSKERAKRSKPQRHMEITHQGFSLWEPVQQEWCTG